MKRRVLMWDGRTLHFVGGPQDGEVRSFGPDHPLLAFGSSYYYHIDTTGPTVRRGVYVRAGNLALWWGWEGLAADPAPGHG